MAILLFAVVIAVLIAVVATRQSRRATVLRSYRRVAEDMGGVALRAFVHEGGLFERPSIEFRHRGVGARLDVHSTGGKHRHYYTQLHFDWSDPSLRCEVFPAGILSRLGKLLGMTDIEIGSAQFDEKFIINGGSPERIRALMSAGLQVAIDRLQRSPIGGDVYVSWGGGQLLIKKRGYLREYRDVRQFVRLGVELFDQASSAGDAGITFLDQAEQQQFMANCGTTNDRVAVCRVCGEEIAERVVHCRSCRTPHHEDCWRYFGACGTYGCGERRFRRLRVKT